MNDRDFGQLLYEKISNEIPKFWTAQIPKYVATANLDLEYSKKELDETLKWCVRESRLELGNEDWSWRRQQGGNAAVSRTLRELTDRTWEGALYWVEKSFGYDEGGPRPQTEGEKLGARLFEIFTKIDDEFFGQLGPLRQVEFLKCKRIARKFTYDIEAWIKVQITRYGGGR